MRANKKNRLKVLLSCYACESDKGSEPGVGWNWTMAMSQDNDVTVVTRVNNEESIRRGLEDHPRENLQFIYYDLPHWMMRLKKKGWLKTSLYYALWQVGVYFKLRKRIDDFDIVHHVTFNMFLCPGYWRPKRAKLILGPLGGATCVPWQYLPLFRKKALVQKIRGLLIKHWRWIPFLKGVFDRADILLCANEDTYSLLQESYPEKCILHLETGIDPPVIQMDEIENKTFIFVQIGSLEARKGWRLSLAAIQKLLHDHKELDFQFFYIGGGPENDKAQSLSIAWGLEKTVQFLGRKSLGETLDLLMLSDVLVFPSVRDTSGNVVLEAMSRSKPVICLNHQGAAEMTDDECAIRITPSDIDQTVSDISTAMLDLLYDRCLAKKMGEHGVQRIKQYYTWDAKRMFMQDVYE